MLRPAPGQGNNLLEIPHRTYETFPRVNSTATTVLRTAKSREMQAPVDTQTMNGFLIGIFNWQRIRQEWFGNVRADLLAGTVVAANAELAGAPELINQDCYGAGWLMRIQPASMAEYEAMLPADDYAAVLAAELVLGARWTELVESLLTGHYDPLYRKSQELNYRAHGVPPTVTATRLDPAGIEQLAASIAATHTTPLSETP